MIDLAIFIYYVPMIFHYCVTDKIRHTIIKELIPILRFPALFDFVLLS